MFLAFWDNNQVKRRDFAVHARHQIVSVSLRVSFFTDNETWKYHSENKQLSCNVKICDTEYLQ